MYVEVILLCLAGTRLTRWELLLAVRRASPRACLATHRYQWARDRLFDVLEEGGVDGLTPRQAFTARVDIGACHGDAEVIVLLLRDLTAAVEGLCGHIGLCNIPRKDLGGTSDCRAKSSSLPDVWPLPRPVTSEDMVTQLVTEAIEGSYKRLAKYQERWKIPEHSAVCVELVGRVWLAGGAVYVLPYAPVLRNDEKCREKRCSDCCDTDTCHHSIRTDYSVESSGWRLARPLRVTTRLFTTSLPSYREPDLTQELERFLDETVERTVLRVRGRDYSVCLSPVVAQLCERLPRWMLHEAVLFHSVDFPLREACGQSCPLHRLALKEDPNSCVLVAPLESTESSGPLHTRLLAFAGENKASHIVKTESDHLVQLARDYVVLVQNHSYVTITLENLSQTVIDNLETSRDLPSSILEEVSTALCDTMEYDEALIASFQTPEEAIDAATTVERRRWDDTVAGFRLTWCLRRWWEALQHLAKTWHEPSKEHPSGLQQMTAEQKRLYGWYVIVRDCLESCQEHCKQEYNPEDVPAMLATAKELRRVPEDAAPAAEAASSTNPPQPHSGEDAGTAARPVLPADSSTLLSTPPPAAYTRATKPKQARMQTRKPTPTDAFCSATGVSGPWGGALPPMEKPATQVLAPHSCANHGDPDTWANDYLYSINGGAPPAKNNARSRKANTVSTVSSTLSGSGVNADRETAMLKQYYERMAAQVKAQKGIVQGLQPRSGASAGEHATEDAENSDSWVDTDSSGASPLPSDSHSTGDDERVSEEDENEDSPTARATVQRELDRDVERLERYFSADVYISKAQRAARGGYALGELDDKALTEIAKNELFLQQANYLEQGEREMEKAATTNRRNRKTRKRY